MRSMLVSARKLLGMSQQEMAKELRVTQDTLTNFETGRTLIPLAVFPQISTIFTNKAEALLSLSKQMNEMVAQGFEQPAAKRTVTAGK